MDIKLTTSTLISCRCALESRIQDLLVISDKTNNLDFRAVCNYEIGTYRRALVELIDQMKNK